MQSIRRYIDYNHDRVIGFFTKVRIKIAAKKYGLNMIEEREQKIIISMTTYNKRYSSIELTLKSLLLQTVKPDRIIIWLDEENDDNLITDTMKEYTKYGIEYRYTELELKPHGKYYYAMLEYPNDIIITVDDDIIYPVNMVEDLLRTHAKYPNAICARRVHLITLKNGKLEKYNNWLSEYRRMREPSHLLFATGVGGVLYPPHLLPQETFNVRNIKELCHCADDIWLKIMEVKNDVHVVWAPNKLVHSPMSQKSQEVSLSMANVLEAQNDKYIRVLREIYPMVFEKLEAGSSYSMSDN